MWLKRECCILPKIIFVWSWYLKLPDFHSYHLCLLFLFILEALCISNSSIFLPACPLFGVCTWSSSSVTSTLSPLTSATSKEFIHAYTYISSSLSSVCQSIRTEARLSLLSATLLISTHLSHFFCLPLEVPPPEPAIYNGTAFHKCHSKTSFMFSVSSVRARWRVP